jgi:hypothetical protein
MSRRAALHYSLRRAVEKDGWTVTDDPLVLVLRQTLLKADLGAEKFFAAEKQGRKIDGPVKNPSAKWGCHSKKLAIRLFLSSFCWFSEFFCG